MPSLIFDQAGLTADLEQAAIDRLGSTATSMRLRRRIGTRRSRAIAPTRRRRGPAGAGTVRYGARAREALDIYAPEGAQAAPVMVFIHCGGWRALSKDEGGFARSPSSAPASSSSRST